MVHKRVFAAVRPYGERIRARVFSFLSSMEIELGDGLLVEAGTPDEETARWVESSTMDLLLLPFHLHRDREGRAVDGIGVAMQLSEDFLRRGVPILMPVSAFSQQASFPRRLAELELRRGRVLERLVTMPEGELGSPETRARLQSLLS